MLHSNYSGSASNSDLKQLARSTKRKVRFTSRSLASMLPSFILSGVFIGLMTALMRLMWFGAEGHFFSSWIENWLTLWPIAFPIMYLLYSPLQKLAARISPPPQSMV